MQTAIREINPPETLAAMREQIVDAVDSKGLVP